MHKLLQLCLLLHGPAPAQPSARHLYPPRGLPSPAQNSIGIKQNDNVKKQSDKSDTCIFLKHIFVLSKIHCQSHKQLLLECQQVCPSLEYRCKINSRMFSTLYLMF